MIGLQPIGLLHSEIHGSMPVYGSPWHIAVHCVLLRLPVPRHSPCALCSLTINYVILLSQFFGETAFGFTHLRSLQKIFSLHITLLCSVFKVHSHKLLLVLSCFRRMVGLSGLEPPTSRLSGARSNRLSYKPMFPDPECQSVARPLPFLPPWLLSEPGGDEENRTPDPLLARQVLSQLSYTPGFHR